MLNPSDNAEDISATEYLNLLIDNQSININGKFYDQFDITKEISMDVKDELMELILNGGINQVREIYIKTIAELME